MPECANAKAGHGRLWRPAQYLTHRNTLSLHEKKAAEAAQAAEEAKIKKAEAVQKRHEKTAAQEEAKRQGEVER